jgi:ATP-dependent Clp protease ATP-binding subunit ClpA
MGRIENFTEGARAGIKFARDEALLLQHDHIGTEHLVLGLLRVPDDPAAMILAELGVALPPARAAVEQAIGRGVGPVLGQIQATSALHTLLRVAARHAAEAGQDLVDAVHLLAALVEETHEATCQVLDTLGITAVVVLPRLAALAEDFAASGAEGVAEEIVAPEDIERRLNDEARSALRLAHDEARRLQHETVDLVHLLIGLLGNEACLAARSLARVGLTQPDLRRAVEFVLGQGSADGDGERDRSPRVWKALQQADAERRKHAQGAIGTGHVLLGIIHAGDSVAGGLCDLLGVRLARVVPMLGSGLDQPPSAD